MYQLENYNVKALSFDVLTLIKTNRETGTDTSTGRQVIGMVKKIGK